MSKRDKPTWCVRLNVDGFSIMTVRTSEEHAERIAKAFGLPWGSEAISRWPLTMHKIGHEVELEQSIMANALAPKMVIPEGEVVYFLVGRKPMENSEEDVEIDGEVFNEWMSLNEAIKAIYEETGKSDPKEWGLFCAGEGTALPQFTTNTNDEIESD